jgi:hypothetical protein
MDALRSSSRTRTTGVWRSITRPLRDIAGFDRIIEYLDEMTQHGAA